MNNAVPSTMPRERGTIGFCMLRFLGHRRVAKLWFVQVPCTFLSHLNSSQKHQRVLQMTLPKGRGKSNPSVRSFLSSTTKMKRFATYSSTAGSPNLKRTERTYFADGSSSAKRQKVHEQRDVPPTPTGEANGDTDTQGCCNGGAHSKHKSQVSKSKKCTERYSELM